MCIKYSWLIKWSPFFMLLIRSINTIHVHVIHENRRRDCKLTSILTFVSFHTTYNNFFLTCIDYHHEYTPRIQVDEVRAFYGYIFGKAFSRCITCSTCLNSQTLQLKSPLSWLCFYVLPE